MTDSINSSVTSVSAPSTPAERKLLGSIVIAKAYEGAGGVQLVLDHSSVVELLEEAGQGRVEKNEETGEESFVPRALGRDSALLMTVRTSKSEGKLVWADTHCIHLSHQVDVEFFGKCLAAARGQAFSLDVLGLENVRVKAKGKKAKTVAPTAVDF